MGEKFQIARRGLPSLISLGALLVAISGCGGKGSSFDGEGGSNPGGGSGNNPSAGTNGVQTGGSSNPTGGNGTTGGNGNTSGSSNPTGGSAGTPGGGGDGVGGSPPAEPCPKPAGEICHEFFANDNARNQINYVNEFKIGQMVGDKTIDAGGVIWTKGVAATGNVNSPRQVEMVDNALATNGKAIMVSVHTGYQEFDMLTGALLVDHGTDLGVSDVRGAVRLANGDTILGVGNDKLRTFNSAGQQVGADCTLPGSGNDSLRVINRDPATGNLLLGRLLDLFIVTVQCQQVWTARLPSGSKAYSVLPRPGGGVYATSGAPSSVIEFNGEGQIVNQVGTKTAHPDLGLDFFSGFEIVNGNFIAANWLGHNAKPKPETPHLVEFKPDNTLVWKWGNQDLARQITNTLMLR
ncbi:MAG TPA: hypothetical protein VJN18_27360 [Polyangiaceae bacterium]|nr:hypothetical protein [Polyangiaceae bacterium]